MKSLNEISQPVLTMKQKLKFNIPGRPCREGVYCTDGAMLVGIIVTKGGE